MNCAACNRPLTADEIGLTKKIVNRGSTVFWCVSCLSRDFRVPENDLYQMIERFRAAGCTLFSPKQNNR